MLRTFDIMLTCVFVFGVISTSGCILFAWRQQKNANILKIIWDEVKWVPFVALFFNSVLFHITTASFTYFFDLKIVWGATCKDMVDMNCFTALKETILTYKREYILFTLLECFLFTLGTPKIRCLLVLLGFDVSHLSSRLWRPSPPQPASSSFITG
jgi:hypothetical protein